MKKNAPKWRLILAAAILPAAYGLAHSAEAEPNDCRAGLARKPNLVFILADDLGYGDLGCYGQKQIETPNIDRLAREGVRFTQFYAGSTVCAPSRCVLMTGFHTGHCYIRGNAAQSLRPANHTVTQLLQSARYTNGLFGKWGLGQVGPRAFRRAKTLTNSSGISTSTTRTITTRLISSRSSHASPSKTSFHKAL